LKENRSTKGLKLALRKLEDAHLIAMKDGYFLSLYETKPKSLKSQSVCDLKTIEGTDHHAEKLKLSATKLQNIIKEIYPGCEITDINLIYSPFFDIVYSNGSAERILRINALSGKAA